MKKLKKSAKNNSVKNEIKRLSALEGLVLRDYLSAVVPDQEEPDYVFSLLSAQVPELVFDELPHGRHGYKKSGQLKFLDDVVGMMCWHGNGGGVFYQLSGRGCAGVLDWHAFIDSMEGAGAYITRFDAALDFFHGEVGVEDFRRMYNEGLFKRPGGGPCPVHNLMGDWDTEGKHIGRTMYVGRERAFVRLCGYEKGRQLGKKDSKWFRLEMRSKGEKNRKVLPWDIVRDPASYYAGVYPGSKLLIEKKKELVGSDALIVPLNVKVITLQKHITEDVLAGHVKRQYGGLICYLNFMYSPETIIQELSSDKPHSKLSNLSYLENDDLRRDANLYRPLLN